MTAQDIAVFQVGNHSDALLPDGTVLARVHQPTRCAEDERCIIHKPSAHHMRGWPLNVRGGGGEPLLFERICEHGVGHPDPDQWDALTRIQRADLFVHGCCGCCADAFTFQESESGLDS